MADERTVVAEKTTVAARSKVSSKANDDKTVADVTMAATKVAPKPAATKRVSSSAAKPAVAKSSSRTAVRQFIGKYPVQGLIAKGGMGAVYAAIHPQLKRKVIIKKLTIRGNSVAKERFKREAEILMEMQSPYIVNTYDYFEEGRSSYLVEELVDGTSLAGLIENYGALGTELSLLVFLDACYGLRFAHNRGIVHRDIKPGNILISRRSEIKLADFGIAANDKEEEPASKEQLESEQKKTVLIGDADDSLTQSGTMLGTPSYMSPEQITDSSSVDQRADVYSMGVMLYEMLTGNRPFGSPLDQTGMLNKEAFDKIKHGDYINPRKFDKKIPLKICSMIRKMLKADPNKRYKSIDSIIKIISEYLSKYDTHEIRVCLAKSVTAITEEKTYKIPTFEKKKPISLIVAAAALGLCFIVGGSAWVWRSGTVHATLLHHWYAPVTVSMQIPNTDSSFGNNIYNTNLPIMAFFFEDAGKQDEVKGSRRVLQLEQAKTEGDTKKSKAKTYTMKPAYLKRNATYRVKLVLGSYVIWNSVRVENKDVDLPITFLQKERRNVIFKACSFDLKTGKDLTSKTKFNINYKGKWVSMRSVPQKDLVAGSVWKIRASCPGYSDKEFSMIVDWYQDAIVVNAGLE